MSLSTGKRSCFIILYHFQNLVKNRFSGNVVDVFFKKKKTSKYFKKRHFVAASYYFVNSSQERKQTNLLIFPAQMVAGGLVW